MAALVGYAAMRAGEQLGRAAHLEVDATPRGVEIDLVHLPRRNQTQRTGEQRLDANAHAALNLINSTPPDYHQPLCMLVSTLNDEGPTKAKIRIIITNLAFFAKSPAPAYTTTQIPY